MECLLCNDNPCLGHPITKKRCSIFYCDKVATYKVEIKGFFHQHMCDQHASTMAEALKPSHFYGMEQLDV
jgi:hypothetical protein